MILSKVATSGTVDLILTSNFMRKFHAKAYENRCFSGIS